MADAIPTFHCHLSSTFLQFLSALESCFLRWFVRERYHHLFKELISFLKAFLSVWFPRIPHLLVLQIYSFLEGRRSHFASLPSSPYRNYDPYCSMAIPSWPLQPNLLLLGGRTASRGAPSPFCVCTLFINKPSGAEEFNSMMRNNPKSEENGRGKRERGNCSWLVRSFESFVSLTNDIRLINKLWKYKQLCQREFNYWQYNMIAINTIKFSNSISKTQT